MRWPVAAAIILALLAGPVLSQTVKIRSGNHPDFARLVLPFAAPSKWRLGRDGKDYVLVISGDGIELDASEVYRLIPQDRVAAVQVSEAGTALRITPGCDCHVNAFSTPSGVLVIDVAEGAVAREFTTDRSTDFKAILTKIKGKQPDAIFYGGMDATGGPMLKQARDLGIKSKFMMADGGCSPEFVKLAGEAAEGFVCSIPGTPVEKLAKGEEFKKRYRARFGTDVQIYSPDCYDATMVMVEAMKRANSADPAKFLPELAKTDYEGITGKIQFDEKGDLKSGAITIYEAKGGKFDVLTTVGG